MQEGIEEQMGRGRYFREMKETWNVIRAYMLESVSEILENNQEVTLNIMENQVVKKRLYDENPKMRPLLLRLSFETCRGGDWRRIIPVCAAMEFLNISTYVINAVFDEKGGRKTREETNRYIIIGMLFRELASKCIARVEMSLSPGEIHEMNEKLSEINLLGYIGQHIDLYQLKKEKMRELGTMDDMKRLYLRRAELLCGCFMRNVAITGAILANATAEQKEAISNYGFILGTAIQMVNDMGDFVLNRNAIDYEKTYQDQFSDIRQGKLTYPVLLGLERPGKNMIKEMLGKAKASSSELPSLVEYLKTSGITDEVRKLTKEKYRLCKRELKRLPQSDARDMLSVMASVIRSNKYYSFFREFKPKPTRLQLKIRCACRK